MGMADAPIMNTGKTPEEAVYCPRAGVTYEQYRDLFHKYLRDNPAHRSVSTHMLFLMAMNSAFPCASSPTFTIDPETGGVYISRTQAARRSLRASRRLQTAVVVVRGGRRILAHEPATRSGGQNREDNRLAISARYPPS